MIKIATQNPTLATLHHPIVFATRAALGGATCRARRAMNASSRKEYHGNVDVRSFTAEVELFAHHFRRPLGRHCSLVVSVSVSGVPSRGTDGPDEVLLSCASCLRGNAIPGEHGTTHVLVAAPTLKVGTK